MGKLEESKELGRKVRTGNLSELATCTFDMATQAVKDGRVAEGLQLIEQAKVEAFYTEDRMVKMVDIILSYMADNLGEETVERVFRLRTQVTLPDLLETSKTPEKALVRVTELHRAHGSKMTITEEPDRYVLRLDPCGSLGRLWRKGEVGRTKKAYPWTWGKVGVPYYCVHCSLQSELMPMEARGYPIGIIECPGKPEEPCIRYYYKNPEAIPEKYFRRARIKKAGRK